MIIFKKYLVRPGIKKDSYSFHMEVKSNSWVKGQDIVYRDKDLTKYDCRLCSYCFQHMYDV